MAGHGKKNVDELLLMALASGASIPAAARKADCSESTVRRRLAEDAFRQSVAEMRKSLVSRAVGQLSALGQNATKTLRGLLKSADEKTRLGAVRTTLEHMFRGTELEGVVREVEELKSIVAQLTAERES